MGVKGEGEKGRSGKGKERMMEKTEEDKETVRKNRQKKRRRGAGRREEKYDKKIRGEGTVGEGKEDLRFR